MAKTAKIAGAGIIGLACARDLARRGWRVDVYDAAAAGQGASWAAGGMLSGCVELPGDHPLRGLAALSLELYSDWIQQIERDSGHTVPVFRKGTLLLGEGDRLDPALEPWLELRADRASLIDEWALDVRALVNALLSAVRADGIEIHEHSPLEDLSGADLFVIASGAWAGHPVRPIKGQMMLLQSPEQLEHVVRLGDGTGPYLIPRTDKRLVLGATVEDAGFDTSLNEDSLSTLWESALAAAPGLGRAKRIDAWAGLRPGTPDDLPLIGSRSGRPDVLYACGHYRNGILLCPATAAVVGDLADHRHTPLDLGAFDPGRFDMTITLNGEQASIADGTTLHVLLDGMSLSQPGVAVALNREVVRRGEWQSTKITEGDQVEIITAAQGG